uniref:Uncharacterized protein n=1 Tax=Triticum urartu TaxID=4572 RepID=A0A8R7JX22_TRIUA
MDHCSLIDYDDGLINITCHNIDISLHVVLLFVPATKSLNAWLLSTNFTHYIGSLCVLVKIIVCLLMT